MKQKRKIGALIGLLLVAAGLWFWEYHGDGPSGTADGPLVVQKVPPIPFEDPQIRIDLIENARKAEYKSSGRNIFSEVAQAAPLQKASGPPKPRNLLVDVSNPCSTYGPCKPVPPPPPPPPVLPANVKCFGFGVVPNGRLRRAFFHDTNGDLVYVVSEGEVLLNRYRILKISNTSIQFEEISSGRPGNASCEEQAGTTPPGGGPSGGR